MTDILHPAPMRAAGTNTPPAFAVPPGACDAHFHVFEPGYPHVPDPHYTFPDGTTDQYLAMTEALGIERMVLVQPTFYGTDNSLLADASSVSARAAAAWSRSRRTPPTPSLTRSTTSASARSGSTCSPAPTGRRRDIIAYIRRMAARVTPRGWHLQFYTPGTVVRDLLPFLADLEDTFVIDHLGYLTESDPDFERRLLAVLAQGSCWIKLSGAYRVAKDKPLSSVAPWARALVAARPDRLIWGSDWPHLPDGQRDTGEILNLLADWAPTEEARRAILVDGPARLFFSVSRRRAAR